MDKTQTRFRPGSLSIGRRGGPWLNGITSTPTPRPTPTPGTGPACAAVRCTSVLVTGDMLVHAQLWQQAREDAAAAGPDGPFSAYPSFNVPPQVIAASGNVGYLACTTASNHTIDRGADGLLRTLDALDAAGLKHTGSYRTEAEFQGTSSSRRTLPRLPWWTEPTATTARYPSTAGKWTSWIPQ